ncbi:copper chaperone PCu(A)C [Kitasatospora sp. NPDC057015]|uniref:copper chaperone PCu(A)C n=1 Tax=Kitasatospora sp. NPDC057015 TaxID=3346001 RepID=UPI00363848FD
MALLCGWTSFGGAGRAEPIEVGEGRILLSATGGVTAAFFVLRNPGDVADELTGATVGPGSRAVLKRHVHRGAAGSWEPAGQLSVPARAEVRMSPEGTDLLVVRPPALRAGQWVEFTLHFRRGPDRTVRAVAVARFRDPADAPGSGAPTTAAPWWVEHPAAGRRAGADAPAVGLPPGALSLLGGLPFGAPAVRALLGSRPASAPRCGRLRRPCRRRRR